MSEGHRAGRRVAYVALPAVAALAHIGPAATWLPGLRRRCLPALAGLGRPGHIALTFDDGPDPAATPRFLDALDGLDVRATFFVLGENVARHPETARELARRGHEVALHGWAHDRPWLPSPGRDVRELRLAARTVREVTGAAPYWYRPPYGILTSGRWLAARRTGLRPVLWTTWGRDWRADATPASVRADIASATGPGGTILLHDTDHASAPDSWHAALAALPAVVADCRERGLTVGPLGEHGVPGTGPAGVGRGAGALPARSTGPATDASGRSPAARTGGPG
ncbi:polysaccharide deacetylase family protein [Streptomyces sp. NPDC003717]|uniref:polysaccharide deacetylase family protein n=1 Tax=Streptomyces sp. NPDC003717 TaxID=3154276 RepID=UPI0033A94821